MGPRCDFACLSKACQQDGAATVYELPVNAKVCAVCGSKRLRRIWTPPHIARGVAAHVDRMTAPVWEEQHAMQAAGERQSSDLRAAMDRVGPEADMTGTERSEARASLTRVGLDPDKVAAANYRVHAEPIRQVAAQVGADAAGSARPAPEKMLHPVMGDAARLRRPITIQGRATVPA